MSRPIPTRPAAALAAALALSPPVGAAAVEVEIGVVQAQLRYSKVAFEAKPGEQVRLTFDNTDELQHNLVVCRAGADNWKAVAEAALKLGAAGVDKGWLPDHGAILAATRMLNPHEEQTLSFQLPDEEGIYPFVCTFPGHAQLMRGEILVSRFPRGLGDLRYRYYEGNWNRLPDFSGLEAAATGKLEGNRITLEPRKRDNGFAFVFEGDLSAPADGEYQFSIASDDGSRLLVDGDTVVDNDGIHGNEQRSGKVRLTQGAHRLEVQYFEAAGGEELTVAWAGPGFEMEPLSAGGGNLDFTDPAEFMPMVFDAAKVVRVRLPDASSRAMAVGLPGGVSFCFDAESCSIRYAWNGGFVDVAPERGNGKGRGGGVCKVLGDRWDVGEEAMAPELLDDHAKPRFAGYRIDGAAVEFEFTATGKSITQRVSAAPGGGGLKVEFAGGRSVTVEPK